MRLLGVSRAELIEQWSRTNGVARRIILELILALIAVESTLADVGLKLGRRRLMEPS